MVWYVISVAPTLGLVQAGPQARADRFTYIPLIGIFMIVAWGAPDLLARATPSCAGGGGAGGPGYNLAHILETARAWIPATRRRAR